MQTETQCPWWDVTLDAPSTDQGDKKIKVPNHRLESPSDTSSSELVHKFEKDVQGKRGPHKKPHSTAHTLR